MTTTRFAPSPTGRLHLGHAYSAIVAHDAARAAGGVGGSVGGGAFRLRIDDIDAGRVRSEFRAAIDGDLAWLGLTIDGPVVVQSGRLRRYQAALDRLRGAGLIYPCFCTRAEITAEIAASASAPHGADGPAYPGTCRGLSAAQVVDRLAAGKAAAWRLDVATAMARAGALRWQDALIGGVVAQPQAAGDVVLWRRDGGPAYHLASTLDDADMGIELVVRGVDLFSATHIHRLLQTLLDLPTPAYHHHPLIAGADGRRLAKRDDAAALITLREAGLDGTALAEMLRCGDLPLPYRWATP